MHLFRQEEVYKRQEEEIKEIYLKI